MNPKDPYTVPLFTTEGDVNRERLPWEPPETDEAVEDTESAPDPDPRPAPAENLVQLDEQFETAGDAHEIKSRIHKMLLERLNLSNLDSYDRSQVVAEIRKVVQDLLDREAAPLNYEEREALVEQVLHEIFGLGPLEPLLQDPTISDILVNTYKLIFIERGGRIEKTDVRFKDDRHLMQVIDRIVSAVGRRIDDSSPMVDARLADGSRVNAVIPPLAIDGPHVSIRKFKQDALSAEDLIR